MSDHEAVTKEPRGRGGEIVSAVREGFSQAFEPVTGFFRLVGDHVHLLGRTIYWGIRPPYRFYTFVDAAEFIGIGSIPIILLVSVFTGAVTALNAVHTLRVFGAEAFTGSAAGIGLATELSPVLTALMLTGRAGAGIATELGSMRITEQIDALETMAVSPVQYLVVPRVLAATVLTPIMTMLSFCVGMLGAYIVAVKLMGVDHGIFLYNYELSGRGTHIIQELIKSVVFGLAFGLIGCFQGFFATGGSRGVGLATMRAVVIGSVTILVLDYFVGDILFAIFPIPR